MPPHPLTNFEIQNHYQNERRFNGVYSRDNLPKIIKDETYIINLHEYTNVGTHCITLYCKQSEIIYFDSFDSIYFDCFEHIPKETVNFTGHKNIKNIHWFHICWQNFTSLLY